MMRASPLFDTLAPLMPRWTERAGMRVPARFDAGDEARAARLGIADVSCRVRAGVKGPGAAAWLATRGLTAPSRPNAWLPLAEDGLLARLGDTEYLTEDATGAAAATWGETAARAYPVLRQDAALVLTGTALPELLVQTCNINFAALDLANRPVVLTAMVGVSVVVLPGERAGRPFYRLWCDSSFGPYLWRTLATIAGELGGGAVGLEVLEAV